jgi:hypothetical protein
VIRDCCSANEENLARIDYADLIALAEELGLLEGQRGLDSFARASLVQEGKPLLRGYTCRVCIPGLTRLAWD